MLAPLPTASDHDQAYWNAAKEGQFLLQRCTKTGRYQFYPRGHSLATGGPDVEWVASPGLGSLYTFTIVYRSFFENIKAPYVFAIVDLDEGVRITSHLVDLDLASVTIGMRVKAGFMTRGDGLPLLVFRKI